MTDPPPGSARHTLSEIEFEARKACRGAGYAWGLAEEAGKAARWLAALDLPGSEVLATLLDSAWEQEPSRPDPESMRGTWRADGRVLCPLLVGAALSDRIGDIVDGWRAETRAIACPLLVVSIAGQAAIAKASVIMFEWPGVSLLLDQSGAHVLDGANHLGVTRADWLRCARHDGPAPAHTHATHRPKPGSRPVPVATWELLARFAHRTYVPASARSRSGAGARTPDTD